MRGGAVIVRRRASRTEDAAWISGRIGASRNDNEARAMMIELGQIDNARANRKRYCRR